MGNAWSTIRITVCPMGDRILKKGRKCTWKKDGNWK
jgi:hypothetical protein